MALSGVFGINGIPVHLKGELTVQDVKLALNSVTLYKLIVATNCFTFSSILDVLSYKTLDVSRVFFSHVSFCVLGWRTLFVHF